MVLLFVAIAGIFVCTMLATACWQTACFLMRKLLGIPKYPPSYEAEAQPLPFYLDNRIPPPHR